jgi:hypothetical protein
MSTTTIIEDAIPAQPGDVSIIAAPIFEEAAKSLEISTPKSHGIAYFEAGIRVGITKLEEAKVLFLSVGEDTAVTQIQEALTALYGVIEGIMEIRKENYNEQVAFQQQYAAWQEAQANYGVSLVAEGADNAAQNGDDAEVLFDPEDIDEDDEGDQL